MHFINERKFVLEFRQKVCEKILLCDNLFIAHTFLLFFIVELSFFKAFINFKINNTKNKALKRWYFETSNRSQQWQISAVVSVTWAKWGNVNERVNPFKERKLLVKIARFVRRQNIFSSLDKNKFNTSSNQSNRIYLL